MSSVPTSDVAASSAEVLAAPVRGIRGRRRETDRRAAPRAGLASRRRSSDGVELVEQATIPSATTRATDVATARFTTTDPIWRRASMLARRSRSVGGLATMSHTRRRRCRGSHAFSALRAGQRDDHRCGRFVGLGGGRHAPARISPARTQRVTVESGVSLPCVAHEVPTAGETTPWSCAAPLVVLMRTRPAPPPAPPPRNRGSARRVAGRTCRPGPRASRPPRPVAAVVRGGRVDTALRCRRRGPAGLTRVRL